MAAIRVSHSTSGGWQFQLRSCCDPRSHGREYERALLVQTLREGGRLTGWDAGSVTVCDRRGRPHTFSA
ncbi:MAG TPA: hypothetical protein VMU66_08965 [Gaiellales bacterium]|nr:hypothetical protein [Gaiellales bacterium]